MSAFIWTITILMSLEAVAKICVLASGNIPQRTPATIATDLVVGIGFICWAVAVLS